MNAVISYFLEWLPNATMFVIVIAAICFICWRVFKYHNNIQKTKEKVDNLPCEANRSILNNIENRINDLDKKVDKLPCGLHQEKISENHHSLEREVIEVKTSITFQGNRIKSLRFFSYNQYLTPLYIVFSSGYAYH